MNNPTDTKGTVEVLERLLSNPNVYGIYGKTAEALQHAISAIEGDNYKTVAELTSELVDEQEERQRLMREKNALQTENEKLKQALEENYQKGRRVEIEKYEPEVRKLKEELKCWETDEDLTAHLIIKELRSELTTLRSTLREALDGLPEKLPEPQKEYPTRKEMTDIGKTYGHNNCHDLFTQTFKPVVELLEEK